MDVDIQSSVYPVESSQQDNNAFGTGFIIYCDGQVSYFLTCAHVVESVGIEQVQIDGAPATVNAIGTSDNLDLAILCVQGLSIQTPLELLVTGKEEDPITVIGMYDYGHYRSRKSIRGYLGPQSGLKKPKTHGGWIKAWDLRIETDNYLQHGYSGSPVFHEKSRKVLAIVSHRRGKGDKGLAISVEAISELWQPGALPYWAQTLVKTQGSSDSVERLTKNEHEELTFEIKSIQGQINSLEGAWKQLAKKIEVLENGRINETRIEEIDRLGYVINMYKEQQREIIEEIGVLVARLHKPET